MELTQTEICNVLEVRTEVTLKNNAHFKEKMAEMLLNNLKDSILDLSNVDYLNSSALGIIADSAIKAKQSDRELVLAGIAPPIDEIFEIVKFGTFMRLFPTREEAEQYLTTKILL